MNGYKKNKRTCSLSRILPLTVTGFLAIMTEAMPVGMLQNIQNTFYISPSLAGQMITVYAAGTFLSAIPVIVCTRGINRRTLLLFALLGFFLTNLCTSFTTNFRVILIERFLAGVSAGVAWGLLTGYATRLAPPSKQGKALAIMGIGQPIALALGVPATAYIVSVFPWQAMFSFVSLLAVLVMIWVRFSLPDFPGQQKNERKPALRIISQKKVIAVLFILFLWVAAHNVMYTYVSPFLDLSGKSHYLDLGLLIFGIGSIAGIIITSMLIDRHLAKTTLIFLIFFVFSGLLNVFFSVHFIVVIISFAIWGITFGGAPTLLLKHLSDCAGKDIDIAQSSLVTVFNMAVSCGTALGGEILRLAGADLLPLYQTLFSFMAFIVFLIYRRISC